MLWNWNSHPHSEPRSYSYQLANSRDCVWTHNGKSSLSKLLTYLWRWAQFIITYPTLRCRFRLIYGLHPNVYFWLVCYSQSIRIVKSNWDTTCRSTTRCKSLSIFFHKIGVSDWSHLFLSARAGRRWVTLAFWNSLTDTWSMPWPTDTWAMYCTDWMLKTVYRSHIPSDSPNKKGGKHQNVQAGPRRDYC